MGSSTDKAFALTEAAQTVLERHFGENARPVLRVFLSFLDDNGPRLDLAPDVPAATDTLCDVSGWRFVVNTQLLQQAAPITVDCDADGFRVLSSLDFSEAGGNCGGSCGSH